MHRCRILLFLHCCQRLLIEGQYINPRHHFLSRKQSENYPSYTGFPSNSPSSYGVKPLISSSNEYYSHNDLLKGKVKGRFESGLLTAKAGILRAGANILTKKANALDKVASNIVGHVPFANYQSLLKNPSIVKNSWMTSSPLQSHYNINTIPLMNQGLYNNNKYNAINIDNIDNNDDDNNNNINSFIDVQALQSSQGDSFGDLRTKGQTSKLETCQSSLSLKSLLQDIFMGHEVIPDVLDTAPNYPLQLTYKTIRTYPGMTVTADMTRFKPQLEWPFEEFALYTVILSNLDINSRRNRTLAEFWHWFVANIPENSIDNGDVIYDLLFPLVLPEGNGNHRFGYFVFKQPSRLDYKDEGLADNCSPSMSNGRGPFKSTKAFQKKYKLNLLASTFLIVNHNEASLKIACDWQKCIGDSINLVSSLRCE